jgi:predicted nucleic acid-binding protein
MTTQPQSDEDLVIYQVIDRADDLNVQQVIANSQLQQVIDRLDRLTIEQLKTQKRMIETGLLCTLILVATGWVIRLTM